MSEFADKDGRRWRLEITVADVPRLKDAGLDVSAFTTKGGWESLERLIRDPLRFVGVLWILCERQGEKAGVSPEEFGRGFNGQAIFDAGDALTAAVLVFTQPPTVARAATTRMLSAARVLEEKAARRIAEQPDPEFPPTGTSSGTAGNSPESPGSMPAP